MVSRCSVIQGFYKLVTQKENISPEIKAKSSMCLTDACYKFVYWIKKQYFGS
jgi:hypothetical protein